MAVRSHGVGSNTQVDMLTKLRAGDPEAQEAFYGKVANQALGYLEGEFAGTLSHEECEDALIDAGMKFFSKIDTYTARKGATLRTWFFTILRNTAIDLCRSRRKEKSRAKIHVTYAPRTAEREGKILTIYTNDITPGERGFLQLWQFGRGESFKSIASILGISTGAVRKRKHGLMKKLARSLEEDPDLLESIERICGGGDGVEQVMP